jgi:hypothetical protein
VFWAFVPIKTVEDRSLASLEFCNCAMPLKLSAQIGTLLV